MKKDKEIERICAQPLENNEKQVFDFITALKEAEASPMDTIVRLSKKLDLSFSEAKQMVMKSPAWKKFFLEPNPLTDEFLKIAAEEAEEIKWENGKVVSVRFRLD